MLIAVAIAIGKVAGTADNRPSYRSEPTPLPTVDTTAGNDGLAEATQSTRVDNQAVIAVAEDFVRAWLRRDLTASEWRSALSSLSTPTLTRDLIGVDPATVPATRQVGEPTVLLRNETYARIAVPMDTGTLTLRIFNTSDRWLVGEVDWERS